MSFLEKRHCSVGNRYYWTGDDAWDEDIDNDVFAAAAVVAVVVVVVVVAVVAAVAVVVAVVELVFLNNNYCWQP